jgi:tRNA threonylcarbamoyladenosine biosynthesis protein TsaE
VLAAPAESGLAGEFDFHDRRRIGKDAVAEGAGDCGDGIGQLLQAVADDLVVVASLGVAGNRRLFRLVGGFGVRQIVERGADYGDRSRVQLLRVGAQFGMAGHIIHLAVAACRQPFAHPLDGRPGFGPRHADGGKAQFPAGLADFFLERRVIHRGVLIVHSPDVTAVFQLPDEAATQRLGEMLAPLLQPGLVIFLEGDLGAGKTTLSRAMIRALGHTGPVKSPTYSLVEVYVISSLYLYHFDFYRFESPEEFLDAGFDEYFNDTAVCLVEWPERAAGCVPAPDLRLRLHHAGFGRVLEAVADTPKGKTCLNALIPAMGADSSCDSPAPP